MSYSWDDAGMWLFSDFHSCDGKCSECSDLRHTKLRGEIVHFCERSGEII